jgi:PAS domain S-box-containing protein
MVLEIDAPALHRLMQTDAGAASAVAAELSRRLEDVHATVADSTFGSMRQRVARHLLALSDGPSNAGRRVAVVTQQQLADGVGTSREVAARALGTLRREGLVRTAPGEIEIIDRPGLAGLLGEWQVAPRRLDADLLFEAQALLDASPNAILAVDSDGSIAYANSSAESSFGWPRDEIVGRPIEVLIPDRFQAQHGDHRAGFLSNPIARPMGRGLDLWGRRRDGTEFPVAVSLTVLEVRDGALIVATVVDMSAARAVFDQHRDSRAAVTEEARPGPARST